MRTPFAISRTARLLGATLALALMAAPAHAADAPFTPRFAQTARGDVAAVGNTVMTCPVGAASCAAAQGGAAYSNNDFAMAYIDADADPATVDSSSATVTLPAGATVLWAGLYWSAGTLQRRQRQQGQAQGPRRQLPAGHRGPVRLPHLLGAVDSLPRLHRRHHAGRGSRRRHLLGRRRPVDTGPTASPAGRCSSPIATTRSRSAASTSTTGSARSTDAHLPDHDRALPHAGHRHGDDEGRAADLRGRRRHRERDRELQRPRADRRAQPGRQRR